MCFVTTYSKIRIATKDIECYKCVEHYSTFCISLHQKFKYDYGQKYSGKSKIKILFKWLLNEDITDEGYHSDIKPFPFPNAKCIIPKGSLYLIDTLSEEYCSSSIIIKEKVEFKNLVKDKLEKLEEKINNFKTNNYDDERKSKRIIAYHQGI